MRLLRSLVALVLSASAILTTSVFLAQPASANTPKDRTLSGTLSAPVFKAPYPCGQTWTYSHHSTEVRLALDFVRSDGGTTAGTPVLASAAGTAYQYYQASGAGNYIVIDHGGGWKTYYFHLSSFSVGNGVPVAQGRQIGVTGSTGNSSGAHIHYEQLYNGVGQTIVINGVSLAPYPGSYYQKYLKSDNGCGSGTAFWTWGSGVRVRTDAYLSSPIVTTLYAPTLVYVLCQKQGDTVSAEGYVNNWWSKLRDQGGFMTNIYIDHPDAKLPGVPVC